MLIKQWVAVNLNFTTLCITIRCSSNVWSDMKFTKNGHKHTHYSSGWRIYDVRNKFIGYDFGDNLESRGVIYQLTVCRMGSVGEQTSQTSSVYARYVTKDIWYLKVRFKKTRARNSTN